MLVNYFLSTNPTPISIYLRHGVRLRQSYEEVSFDPKLVAAFSFAALPL